MILVPRVWGSNPLAAQLQIHTYYILPGGQSGNCLLCYSLHSVCEFSTRRWDHYRNVSKSQCSHVYNSIVWFQIKVHVTQTLHTFILISELISLTNLLKIKTAAKRFILQYHRNKFTHHFRNLANTPAMMSDDIYGAQTHVYINPSLQPLTRKQRRLVTKNPGTIVAIAKVSIFVSMICYLFNKILINNKTLQRKL